MSKIKQSFLKQYLPDEKVNLLFFGHDDFLNVKPWKKRRVQNFWTLHCVLRGKGYYLGQNTQKVIRAGEAFITFPDENMVYYPDENDPWEYVWFAFDGDRAGEIAKELGVTAEQNVCVGDFSSSLGKIYELAEDAVAGRDSRYGVLSVFYGVLNSIMKPVCLGSDGAKAMIDNGFTLPEFSVGALCERCGISHAQLCRDFMRKWGTSPKKYLESLRLNYGCELLENTALSITEIAYSCGYGDSAHFMKTFKKNTGFTCGEYRKRAKMQVFTN